MAAERLKSAYFTSGRRKAEFLGNIITRALYSFGNHANGRAVQYTGAARDANGSDWLAILVKDGRPNAAQPLFNLFVIDGEAGSTHLV